jgi:WD40 repeat protein
MSEQTTAAKPRDCPYVGLDYYREDSGAWFFGREADGDKIITNLLAARLTLLHAESGVGKSSLLRAGVAWRLSRLARAERPSGDVVDLPVVFNSWKDDPVKELVGAIREATKPFLDGRPVPDLPCEQLDAAIEAAAYAVDANLLVILDQFEEYFLYRLREPAPERFADELARCVNRADVPANFLIAIREDAYAGLGDLFKGRIANVYGNYLHIEYLDRESADQAIRAPIEVYNGQPGVTERVTIQSGLVDAVLHQVRAHDAGGDLDQDPAVNGGGERFATPLLQLAMETIWKRELGQGSHELRLSTLDALQGVGKIVDTHVWQALRALGDGERQTAIDVFDHLVTPSGGKIAESVPDLAKRTGHREEQVSSVLGKLDRARIVRPVPAPPGQDPMRFRRYEIFHDVLAPTINRVIAAREDRRRARRLWRLSALAVGLLIVSVVLSGVFFYLWRHSVNERQMALSDQMAAVANSELTVDPDMSALLARQALSLYDTSQAEAALRAALSDVQERATLPPGTAVDGTSPTRAAVFGAAFDPADANEVASAAQDGNAWIWNVKTGQHLVRLWPQGDPGPRGTADAVAFNPAGTQVAVGYQSGDVIVFSTSGTRLQQINVGHVVNNIQFVGNTGELAIATYQNAVLWVPQDRSQPLHVLYKGQANNIAADPVNNLEFALATASGARILTLNSDLRVANPAGVSLPTPSGLQVNDVEFSNDGSELAAADGDGVVRVYAATGAKQTATLDAGRGVPEHVAIGPAGKLIVAGYSSGATIVWDASSHTQMTQLIGNDGTINQVQFTANGQEVVTASEDGSIRVWRAQPRELAAAFPTSQRPGPGMTYPAYAANYSPDGSRILAVDGSGFAYVLTGNGTTVATINPPTANGYVNTALYNQAGTQIVTADTDGTVDLWQVGGSYQQINLPSPIQVTAPASYAAFSPNGDLLVVINGDGNAEIFNAQSGRWLHTLNPNSQFLLTVAVFSQDGRQVLTGDGNGQVEVWNTATGRKIRVLGTKGPGINDVQFDRTGKYFVTASDNGFVTIWSAGDQRLNSFRACPSPNTAALSPGGGDVVVACSGGSVPVFTAAGHEMTVMSDPGIANSAAFSPNGTSIVTTFGIDQTGGVRVWNAELANSSRQKLEQLAKQRIIGSLSQAQIDAALAGTSGWPSTP